MAVALAGPPSASGQEILAAGCAPPVGHDYHAGFPADVHKAQTFTVQVTGPLTRAELAIFRQEQDPAEDYLIQIRATDASGAPGTVLASATLPGEAVPVIEAFEDQYPMTGVEFPEPTNVVPGRLYAISVVQPGTGHLGVGTRFDCPGTRWFAFETPPAWEMGPESQLAFRVFVTLPPAAAATCRDEPATITGTDGNDELTGTPGRDVIAGLGGRDEIRALDGDDLICGNRGRDVIRGQSGEDRLYGARGKDRLFGGAASDLLVGGADGDSLFGGNGKDRLRGGSPDAPGKDARDRCRGGAANDKLRNCER